MNEFEKALNSKLDEALEGLEPDVLAEAQAKHQALTARKTIFPVLSLNRTKIKWDDYLFTLTPNELHKNPETGQRVWFKREDYFAPLSDYANGRQGINGSKLRQAIWLMQQHILQGGSPDIVHGTVMGSPQSPMATAVSRHFGGKTTTVLGATKPNTCMKAEMVEMSAWFGSEFNFVGSGYNTVIQPRCLSLLSETKPDAYYLEYGITLDHEKHSSRRLADFHALGGHQVQNIPDHITDLIIPAGSCNSTCSIMTGLAMHPKPNLKNVWLIGIGPNRLKFIEDRLDIIGRELGLPHIRNWVRDYRDNPDFGTDKKASGAKSTNVMHLLFSDKTLRVETESKEDKGQPRFTVHHVDLHTTNWVRYNDLMEYQWGDIELHPRYEGKVMSWVQQNKPELLNENSLFWIVGSKPYIEPMREYCPELSVPEQIQVNDFIPAAKRGK
uniref:Threonine deaminase n=1 Tax=Serratia phage Kevin TaxID=3161161 RepID=A0AAU8L0A8_9CAUD